MFGRAPEEFDVVSIVGKRVRHDAEVVFHAAAQGLQGLILVTPRFWQEG